MTFKYFGCDFDPNPDIDCLRRKIVNFLSRGGSNEYCGPYMLFENEYKNKNNQYLFGGGYGCPNWVTATPFFNREIYPEMFRDYINAGNCRIVADGLGDFVAGSISEGEIPVTIGVDHCLTGGIYRALKKKRKEVVLVVFDMHADAITPHTRNDLVNFYEENLTNADDCQKDGFEHYADRFEGNYDTGSFLSYLFNDGSLRREELMVLGIQDEPDKELKKIKDERVGAYIREWEALINGGAKIVPLSRMKSNRLGSGYENMIDCLVDRDVYLSIDTDVFEGKLGVCARYGSEIGIKIEDVGSLLERMGIRGARLVGMDIMETDVNALRDYDMSGKALALQYDSLIRNITAALRTG